MSIDYLKKKIFSKLKWNSTANNQPNDIYHDQLREMTNLNFCQHKLEPIKVSQILPSLLNNEFSAPGTTLPLLLDICQNKLTIIIKKKKKTQHWPAKMILVHSQLTVLTSFLHSIQQFLLLGNPLNVNFNVSQRKPLEIHLGPFHVRSINKSLYQLMKQM